MSNPIINDVSLERQEHLQPNLQMTQKFLTLLSEGESSSDKDTFTFQTFTDNKSKGGKHYPQILHGTLEQHREALIKLNQQGSSIFVTVNKTDGTGRKTENITAIRAVFVDLDGSPLEPIYQCALPPHIIIESSIGRYHAYWILEGLPLEEFSDIQKMLAATFKGDPKVYDLPRVMRLPGFYHQKGTPYLSKIINESGERPYTKELFLTKLNLNQEITQINTHLREDDIVLQRLDESHLLIKKATHPSQCWLIKCPWEILHTTSKGEAKYFEPSETYPFGGFNCFHDHCKDKTLKDLKEFLGIHRRISTEPLPLHRPLTAPQPFPMDALGPVLKPAALALRRVIQAPDAVCAQSVLGAAALAVQPYANVSIDGRRYPLSLFLITVAESGDRKSATDKFALKPIYDFQKTLCNTFRTDSAAHRLGMELWEAKKKEWLKCSSLSGKQSTFTLPCPIPPLSPLCLVEEPTYEGIVKYFDIGQPSIGLFSDEGGRFFGGHAMSKDNQIKTIAGISSLWDGKEISRMRGGDGSIVLYGRRLSVHLMIQEVILENLMSNHAIEYQGFLPRCLITYPESTAGQRPYVEQDLNDDDDLTYYWWRMKGLLERKFPVEPPPAPQNELHPPDLPLTLPAKNHWIQFHDAIDRDLVTGRRLEPIHRFGNKAAEHVLRLAGILSVVENDNVTVIELKHIEAAIALVEYYLSEALRIQGCLTIHPEIVLARKILDWCWTKEKEVVSLKEIYHGGPTELRQAKKARSIMAILEDHGWATPLSEAIIEDKPCKEAWRILQKIA